MKMLHKSSFMSVEFTFDMNKTVFATGSMHIYTAQQQCEHFNNAMSLG